MNSRFSFGRNWHDYLNRNFSEEKVIIAIDSLKNFLSVQGLNNKTFLDIGSGSGLFSLAAYRLGARKVVSFDSDPYSVKCCRILREREGRPRNWVVLQGSILDKDFIQSLKKFDIVYSWGVLHHTGNMWGAIANVASLANREGLLYFSIYNRRRRVISSRQWLKIKRLYNVVPRQLQKMIEYFYIVHLFLLLRCRMRKFKEFTNTYSALSRGMDWRTDIVDWLGGLPYECATVNEVISRCQVLGLNGVKHKDVGEGLGCNEFLFVRAVEC